MVILLFSLALNGLFAVTYKNYKVTVPLRFDHYYTYDMVVKALKALNQAYPSLTKLEVVGTSEEGRNIYCMTVNNPKTGPALSKPGIYVDGNIHGNEIQAGEVCLYVLNELLTKNKNNKEITKLVNTKCFYVVPVVNPDGRFHFMNDASTASSNRGLRRPKDDDHDGLLDEDFPDDLDGDGNICQMRKKDPFGQWKTDPEEPRLMKRIKPGEKGEWTIMGMEGIDNDGDGRINEDSEGYVDPNRNWAYNWGPPYVQGGAGDYPLSGTGIKALATFLSKKTNICMSWAFHNTGGMIVRGPATKAEGEFLPGDVAVYDYLGNQSERILPGYRYLVAWKDMYETYGDFDSFMHMSLGIYCYVGELFMDEQETFKTRKEEKKSKKPDEEDGMFFGNPDLERERLQFNDHLTQGELFKEWKPFKHPTYGDIEIGGWVKMSTRLSHPFMLKDLCHRNAAAVLFSAKHTPEVSLEVFEVTKVKRGLNRVRIRLSNTTSMPSMSYHAQKVKLYPKDVLTLSGKNSRVLAGGHLTDIYRNMVSYKEHRPELQFLFVPGFGKVEYQFLVSGKGAVNIQYKSRHAGTIKKTIKLK